MTESSGHICYDPEKKELRLLDQRLLPEREEYFLCKTAEDVIWAIQEMVVRGAPAIGVSSAFGCVLALKDALAFGDKWKSGLNTLLDRLASARPTAVNLSWAVKYMRQDAEGQLSPEELLTLWEDKAVHLQKKDIADNKAMGHYGAELFQDGDTVITHCNAGALATAGYGTALGVIRAAVESGKKIKVFADETRPLFQGARLSAFELQKSGIPVTVITDNAAGFLMRRGEINRAVVGADRIAGNGDTANKIGTYSLAVLCRAHGIPFYVAAPFSTFDLSIASGGEIEIEQRAREEVSAYNKKIIVPDGVPVLNYAFDVTPHELISAIITEKGILKPPFGKSIKEFLDS